MLKAASSQKIKSLEKPYNTSSWAHKKRL